MGDTLTFFVSGIVDNPKDVHIQEEQSEGLTTFSIQVHKEDMGKVIGKEGKVIRAIRNVMKIIAMKHNVRINVVLSENQ